MSEAKFTPGPWLVSELAGFEVFASGFGRGELVAQVFMQPENARLIAAAPEMYEALEKLLDDPQCPTCQAQARAALAKATGK